MKDRFQLGDLATLLFAATVLLLLGTKCCPAAKDNPSPAPFHAVVIQAAGHLPEAKKPEGADAITHATTKKLNTYVLTSLLTEKLKAAGVEVRVIDYTKCPDLSCLYSQKNGDKEWKVDLVIFAGPSYYSKQPKQLLALLPKLDEVVKQVPDIVCTTLIPAWYPKTKGIAAIKHTEHYFEKAGALKVTGISVLTPREKKPGIGEKELEETLSKFVAVLVDTLTERNR